jgi:O-antigen ligase
MNLNSLQANQSTLGRQKWSLPIIGGIIVVLAVFSRELGKGSLIGLDIDFISYPLYILFALFLTLTLKLSVDRTILMGFIYVLASGMVSKMMLGLQIMPLIKQLVPIILIYGLVGYAITRLGPEVLFKWYVKLAFLSAIIGLVQLALKLYDIHILTEYRGFFIDSIAEEPSHYAAIVLPALVYTYIFRKIYLIQFLVILAAVIFTFNLTAYFVSMVMLLIIYGQFLWLLVLLPMVYLLGNYLYWAIPNFKLRIDGVIQFINEQTLRDLHGTPLSFFSNWSVAVDTLRQSPIFGSGLGGHEEMYYRYFEGHAFSRLDYLFGLNAKSAHSLTIRVLSELGLIGFSLFIYVLSWPLRWRKHPVLYAIGLGCLAHFMCKTLKLGNYFDLGTPFFLLLIFFIGREVHRRN